MQMLPFPLHKLDGRAVISVTGPEASPFLQNLVTADVADLREGQAVYAALLQPQGKILFDFFILRHEDGFLLDCVRARKADLLKRLMLYKLRSQVTLGDGNDEVGVSFAEPVGLFYRDPRLRELGFRIIAEAGTLPRAPDEAYRFGTIRYGIADSEDDIGSGALFPHEANLDQLGAVSFTKGCYIGQEVVSRMQHRGTARNRILPVHITGGAPTSGINVMAGTRIIGSLLSSRGSDALALLRIDRLKDAVEAGETLLTEGKPLRVRKPDWVRFDVTLPEESP
ncbi:folate-binding protein YgfZ [soil metagenome]